MKNEITKETQTANENQTQTTKANQTRKPRQKKPAKTIVVTANPAKAKGKKMITLAYTMQALDNGGYRIAYGGHNCDVYKDSKGKVWLPVENLAFDFESTRHEITEESAICDETPHAVTFTKTGEKASKPRIYKERGKQTLETAADISAQKGFISQTLQAIDDGKASRHDAVTLAGLLRNICETFEKGENNPAALAEKVRLAETAFYAAVDAGKGKDETDALAAKADKLKAAEKKANALFDAMAANIAKAQTYVTNIDNAEKKAESKAYADMLKLFNID